MQASELLAEYCSNTDYIVCGAICDEGSKYWSKLKLPEGLQSMAKPVFRGGLAFIYSGSQGLLGHGVANEIEIRCTVMDHEISVLSGGFVSGDNKGAAMFRLGRRKYSLRNNRGLNVLILDSTDWKAVDLFSVDTFGDPRLRIHREHDLFGIRTDAERASFDSGYAECVEHLKSHDFPYVFENARLLKPYHLYAAIRKCELLLRSGDEGDLKDAYETLRMINEAYPKMCNIKLSLMCYHGIGTDRNPEEGRRFYIESLKRAEPVLKDLFILNPAVFEHRRFVARGSEEDRKRIIAFCIQHLLPVEIDEDSEPEESAVIMFKKDSEGFDTEGREVFYLDVFDDSVPDERKLLQVNTRLLSKGFVIVHDGMDDHVKNILRFLSDNKDYKGSMSIENMGDIEDSVTPVIVGVAEPFDKDHVYDTYALNYGKKFLYPNSDKGLIGDVESIIGKYRKGRDYVSALPLKKHVICGWGALGDLTKMAALVDSYNDRLEEKMTYLVRSNRGHVREMYPGLDVLTQDAESFECVRTYLELSQTFDSDRIWYVPKFREDSLFIPDYRLHGHVSDYDMQHCMACFPSDVGYSHAYGRESDRRYEGSVLLVPNAGWTFSGNDAYRDAVRGMLSDISSKLAELGIKVYANSKEPFGKAEPLFLSPEEMSVHASDFAHIVGPMTGLMDLLILSDCRSASIIYGTASFFNWYDSGHLATPEQEIFKHDLSAESYEEVFEKVLDRCIVGSRTEP